MLNKKIILGLILSVFVVLTLVGMIYSYRLEKETIAKFKEINPLINEEIIERLRQSHPDYSDEKLIERLIAGIETVKRFNPYGISDEEIIERIETAIIRINHINAQNLGWTAGLTGMSLLSHAEMKFLNGLAPLTEEHRKEYDKKMLEDSKELEELIKERFK